MPVYGSLRFLFLKDKNLKASHYKLSFYFSLLI
ncbi:hypothetical protein PRIO_3789 [Paenibacillus riograndensis SBR5]|uniref:Uncharacterized protein n=1 Tax=Paenibacillus riograndensis SBR5 TaxID=1073571 RepID=A0A0E4CXB5_9BACL|nr:hypothetical protein PRIO_3789 [Paenibacillus riograndensis SBR5]